MDESIVEHSEASARRARIEAEEKEIWVQSFGTVKQKNTAWTKNIVQKITKPGHLVVDAGAATFFVAKTVMILPKHRRLIGCEVNLNCLIKTMLLLVMLYTWQVLCKESDIDEAKHVHSSAEVYVRAVGAIEGQKCLDRWKVAGGLPLIQKVQPYILYHLSTYFGEEKLVRNARNIPVNR